MSDLLRAQVSVPEIVTIVGVSKTMVYDTKKKLEAGDSLERKPGSGGSNKIITDDFLTDLLSKIEADPTRSMRKLAKDLNVDEKTIRNAVGQLGLCSYVRRSRRCPSYQPDQASSISHDARCGVLRWQEDAAILVPQGPQGGG